jgi:hypothetical protein
MYIFSNWRLAISKIESPKEIKIGFIGCGVIGKLILK